jgi:hypothetical protein
MLIRLFVVSGLLFLGSFTLQGQEIIYKTHPEKGMVDIRTDANYGVLQNQSAPVFKEFTSVNIQQENLLSNEVLSSLKGKEILFPDEKAVFKIDIDAQNIEFLIPDYSLNPLCESAMNKCPNWLKDDLHRQFRKLAVFKLDGNFANLIINAPNEIVDEISFQIANLSTESLKDSRFRNTMELLTENAQHIYDVVDSLKYVRLVEHGSYASGDFYTTTEYKVKDGGNFIWVEIPKEIYYWYVLMPKIDREGVYKQDKTSSSQFRTYGYFWREYLWSNPHSGFDYTQVNISTSKGSIDTIQRFGAIMQMPEYLWDRVHRAYSFNRSFDPEDHALDVLGNWASRALPIDAVDNRPFEPNQIIFEHDGNCHEDALLVAAACRTALIPIVHIGVHGEDHAYGMIWDEDWHHYEFFRGGFSNVISPSFAGITNMYEGGSYGWTTSIAHTTRADGYKDVFSSYYNDKICTQKVLVLDKNGNPVDGAKVEFWCSPGPYSSGWVDNVGFAWTDNNGMVELKVGAGKKYGYQVYHKSFGYIPSSTQANIINTTIALDGQTYETTAKFTSGDMPALPYGKRIDLPKTASYGLHIQFNAHGVIAGQNLEDVQNSTFSYKIPDDGSVSFFICDQANYTKYTSGQAFDYYFPVKNFNSGNLYLPLPSAGKWYVIFSNEEATTNLQQLEADVEIISDAVWAGVDAFSEKMEVKAYPNPFSQQCYFDVAENVSRLEIVDLYGKLVQVISDTPYVWKPDGNAPDGVYVVKSYSDNTITSTRILYRK